MGAARGPRRGGKDPRAAAPLQTQATLTGRIVSALAARFWRPQQGLATTRHRSTVAGRPRDRRGVEAHRSGRRGRGGGSEPAGSAAATDPGRWGWLVSRRRSWRPRSWRAVAWSDASVRPSGPGHAGPDGAFGAALEDGSDVSAETLRRVCCDAGLVPVIEGARGEVLGRRAATRAIPPAIRRALHVRDRGCRFPGCRNRAFVHAHHVEHWLHGGETRLGNPCAPVHLPPPARSRRRVGRAAGCERATGVRASGRRGDRCGGHPPGRRAERWRCGAGRGGVGRRAASRPLRLVVLPGRCRRSGRSGRCRASAGGLGHRDGRSGVRRRGLERGGGALTVAGAFVSQRGGSRGSEGCHSRPRSGRQPSLRTRSRAVPVCGPRAVTGEGMPTSSSGAGPPRSGSFTRLGSAR